MIRPPLAGVFGGGGLFGIGFALGVLDGLRESGLDMSTSHMLGTSAGSWAASAVALGVDFEELARLDVPTFPNPKPGLLASVARRVFGDRTHDHVHVIACSLPRLRRTVLDGASIPLSDLVAASSAVPGLLAPHAVNGTSFVDGGVRSAVSADLAPIADHLIVVAPLAGAMFGPFGGLVTRRMEREIAAWRSRGGGTATVFSPDEPTSATAKWPWQLFDRESATRAHDLGRRQALSGGTTIT